MRYRLLQKGKVTRDIAILAESDQEYPLTVLLDAMEKTHGHQYSFELKDTEDVEL